MFLRTQLEHGSSLLHLLLRLRQGSQLTRILVMVCVGGFEPALRPPETRSYHK